MAPHRFAYTALMPVNRLAAAQWLFASGDSPRPRDCSPGLRVIGVSVVWPGMR